MDKAEEEFVMATGGCEGTCGGTVRTIPLRGVKEDGLEAADEPGYHERLHEARRAWWNALRRRRGRRGRALAHLVWNSDDRNVRVHVERGSGFTSSRIPPEEAVYAVEHARAMLWHRGVPVSLRGAHRLAAAAGVPFDLYLVYARLRRLGYAVRRRPVTGAGDGDSHQHWAERSLAGRVVAFDCWVADRSTRTETPSFYVYVCRFLEDAGEILQRARALRGTVPGRLRCAIVDEGSVTFAQLLDARIDASGSK